MTCSLTLVCFLFCCKAPPPSPQPTLSPTIAPDCAVDVTVDCVEVSTQKNCADIEPIEYLVCDCPDSERGDNKPCAKTYSFLYTGEPCRGSNGEHTMECVDNRSGAPDKALIIAKDATGRAFDRVNNVMAGTEVTFADMSGCFPDLVEFEIRDSEYTNRVHQRVAVNTQCAGRGVQLADSAGALDFVGYTCKGGKQRNCLTEIVFEVNTENTGPIAMEVTDISIDFDGEVSSPMISAGPRIRSGLGYTEQDTQTISICQEARHSFDVTVEAMGSFGKECFDETGLIFNIEQPGTNPPTPAPTNEPTPPPSPAPTRRPTPLPTPRPSPGPTPYPSRGPTPLPSPRPTPRPTEQIVTRRPVGRPPVPQPVAQVWTHAPVHKPKPIAKGKGEKCCLSSLESLLLVH